MAMVPVLFLLNGLVWEPSLWVGTDPKEVGVICPGPSPMASIPTKTSKTQGNAALCGSMMRLIGDSNPGAHLAVQHDLLQLLNNSGTNLDLAGDDVVGLGNCVCLVV